MESDPPDEGKGPQALIQQAKAAMRDSPVGLADIALPTLGGLGSFALANSHDWPSVGVGVAAGLAVRLLQISTVEQKVPFTLRKHTVLLPVWAELLLGQYSFSQILQQPQYRGKALPPDHSDVKLVKRIAERIISAVEEGHGAGFQKHIAKFDWEVTVLDDKTVNAFVLPGGKIVVFNGLIKLFNRDEDMIATVIGHECAHALARHSGEKITLGLFIALAVQLGAYAIQRTMRPGQPYYDREPYGRSSDPRYGGRDPRYDSRLRRGYQDPRGYGRNPYSANPYDNPYYSQRNPYAQSRRGNSIYYIFPDQAMTDPTMAAGPRGLPGPGRGYPGRGGGFNPVGGLVNIATNLLLQLPFSRRAEAEADLIGLKLMSIAGYNQDKAPTTFAKMEEYQAQMMGKAASNASYIQDHPRSANRVKLLQGELDMMKKFGKEGCEVVLSKVPYWML
jgi:Zn-dependent protease with chaperone function